MGNAVQPLDDFLTRRAAERVNIAAIHEAITADIAEIRRLQAEIDALVWTAPLWSLP
jgi:hypothetical protein